MRQLLFAVLVLVFPASAQAIQPESGWWWNAAEPGRGFAVEVQNNTMFFAGYLYDSAGAATWYASAGAYSQGTSSYFGPLLSFTGGQCLTCSYRPNSPGPSPGNVGLVFDSPSSGTLTWPGGSIRITRFIYGTVEDYRRLAGRWVFTSVISSLSSADWINFDSTLVSGGNNFVGGTIQGGRVAVGAVQNGEYSVLIDSSTSYYDLFICPPSRASVEQLQSCSEWLYQKTSSPTGPGSQGQAFKYGAAVPSIAPPPALAAKQSMQALTDELLRATALAKREADFAAEK